MNPDIVISTLSTVVLWGGGALLAIAALVWLVKTHLHICEPHELLIFSGRTHRAPDGRSVGFRVIHGGRAFRVPIVEKVDRMDMTLISVPMHVRGAYSEGGIPLSVTAIANVKVASSARLVGNAIERFLGQSREEIARVAKETLEGHLRGVLATMTPEEVNEDRLKFADRLTEEAETDLHKLGLQLDTLKIQHVSDDRSYLDSIGRTRIAEIVRAAEVAESDALRAAEETEAACQARGGVARTRAEAKIAQKRNQLRQIKAQLEAQAKSEEERATAAARGARFEAERELQTIRAQQEELRLMADVTIPAGIQRRVKELEAEGQAAAISEHGRAVADAMGEVTEAWQHVGDRAMDAVLVQHVDEIVRQAAEVAGRVRPTEVALLDKGDGQTIATYARAYPATVKALLDEVRGTLGVDVTDILGGDRRGERAAAPSERDAA